jgi:hypothetical protein
MTSDAPTRPVPSAEEEEPDAKPEPIAPALPDRDEPDEDEDAAGKPGPLGPDKKD